MARSTRNVFVSANRDFVNRMGFHWSFLHLRENVTEKVKKSAAPGASDAGSQGLMKNPPTAPPSPITPLANQAVAGAFDKVPDKVRDKVFQKKGRRSFAFVHSSFGL